MEYKERGSSRYTATQHHIQTNDMTETVTEKTKRIFTTHLLSHEWSHQLSIFYTEYTGSLGAIEDSKIIRKALVKNYPNQSFLWRLCLKRKLSNEILNAPVEYKYITMPYQMLFTNHKLSTEEFSDLMEREIGSNELYIKKRKIARDKVERYARSVKKEAPHNLHKVFPEYQKINRFSFINKAKATPYWDVGMPLDVQTIRSWDEFS